MLRSVGLALVVAISCDGCASSFATRIIRTAPIPIIVGQHGVLASGPTTLTLSDIARQGNTPAGAALRDLFDIEWGFASGATARVAPKLLAQIGSRQIEAAYRDIRSTVAQGHPVIRGVNRYGNTWMVTVDLLNVEGRPQRELMLYAHERGRWVSAYDTMMLLGVALAAESEVQSLDKPLSGGALQAGNAAQAGYRHVATGIVGARLPGPAHA